MQTPGHDPLIGRTLREKWRIDAQLGRGGMATVYEATHRNGMRGAIKILHPQYAADENLRKRLVREGQVANHVQHAGVVRVIDDDATEDGLAFVVMELLRGQTWKAKWTDADRVLPARDVLQTARAVLDILVAAHEAGVIHRDIKPDNVFLTSDGEVKLLDFGIARLREAHVDHTQTGAMLGTPAFMSPEQAMARWSQVDARSDLYSVGATIWALVTGRLVHVCETVPEILVAAATRKAEPFASVFDSSTPELALVVDRALMFDKADRWQTAREMRDAVDRALESLDGSVTRPPRGMSASTSAPVQTHVVATPRKPAGFGLGLAIGGGLAAAIAIAALWDRFQAPPVGKPTDNLSADSVSPTPVPNVPTSEAPTPPPDELEPTVRASASAPKAPRVSPRTSASARKLGPFDHGKALEAIQREAAKGRFSCSALDGPRFYRVEMDFNPEGGASSVQSMPLADGITPAGACMMGYVGRARVEPFDGARQHVSTTVALNPG